MAVAVAAAALFRVMALLFSLYIATTFSAAAATWCVARSDASDQALQMALDYACAAGADCVPIQSSGLCYLPNTLQAHASYAFNSYYQRRGNAPDSCSFGGIAAIAKTDPSYGSCIYPPSPRTAGGMASGGTSQGGSTTGGTPTITIAPPPPGTTTPFNGNGGGSNPGMSPIFPDSPMSNASRKKIITCATFLLFFGLL